MTIDLPRKNMFENFSNRQDFAINGEFWPTECLRQKDSSIYFSNIVHSNAMISRDMRDGEHVI